MFLADGGGKDNKLDKAAPQMSIQIVAFFKKKNQVVFLGISRT